MSVDELSTSNGSTTEVAKPVVEVSDLAKEFKSKSMRVLALHDLSTTVRRGEFVSIIGPSGCGKSTLLAIVAGLDQPTAGTVRIEDQEVTEPYTPAGVVFQEDLLLEWRTCLSNVLLQFQMRGMRSSRHVEQAMKLLELVGVEQFAHRYPRQLSGGMRQRVSICRALVHDPSLLLMDEPFGALDALTRERLNIDLARICAEARKTVLFITHSIDEAVFLSDRILVMSPRPGRIAADIPVRLPRPRQQDLLDAPEFGKLVKEVRGLLGREGAYDT